MRANDVSGTQVTAPAIDAVTQHKAGLMYELELEFRRTAKALLRRGTALAPLLLRVPSRSTAEADGWQDTSLKGWMIGPNICLLDSGSWVPFVVGRTHKLDKPRHNIIFGDANTKRYAQEWQVLTDVGVAPGGPYMRLEPENLSALSAAVDPDRAQMFEVEKTHTAEVLTFTYPWGQGNPRTDVLRDDLQRWVTDYLSQ